MNVILCLFTCSKKLGHPQLLVNFCSDLYAVAREADTERAFTGKMWNSETKGTYYCATCGYRLFKSEQKFTSSCGWPSFFEQVNKQSITFKDDNLLLYKKL